MIHKESKYDFHIGNMIKELASQRGITSDQLAKAINRYKANESRIFKLADMNVDDVIQISYLLKYNILEKLCDKYLSYLPINRKKSEYQQYIVTFDMRTKRYTKHGNSGNCDFLKDIHIGPFIKMLAKENKWNEQDVATQLHYTQSEVSDLYRREHIKVKQLFYLSDALSIAPVLKRLSCQKSFTFFGNHIFLIGSRRLVGIGLRDKADCFHWFYVIIAEFTFMIVFKKQHQFIYGKWTPKH